MFEIVCDRKLICVTPTLKVAEQYVAKLIKRDIIQAQNFGFKTLPKYKIIEEILEVK